MKDVLFRCADVMGINASLRTMKSDKLVIVCYHSILPASHRCGYCTAAVSTTQFARHLELFRRYFVPVSPRTVVEWTQGRATLPKRALMITIDDGFRNNLAFAVPELLRRGFPALISVTTGYVGTNRHLWTLLLKESIVHWPHHSLPMPGNGTTLPLPTSPRERCLCARTVIESCKTLPEEPLGEYLNAITREIPSSAYRHLETSHTFLTWEDIRGLHRQGFEFGSHGVSHVSFARLPLPSLRTELRESKKAIEDATGDICDWITYPFGDPGHVTGSVVAEAESAGYRGGLVLFEKREPDPRRPLVLDRVFIDGQDSEAVFRGRLSGFSRWMSAAKSTVRRDGHADLHDP